MATWERALESLDPADIKLNDEYENELEGARKLPISAVELKAISSQPIGDDSPSDRVLCMPYVDQRLPSEILVIRLSSVCAYTNFRTNLDLLRLNSQASRLLAAYQVCPKLASLGVAFLSVFVHLQTFRTGTLLMSRRNAESPVFNMPSVCLYHVSCALNLRPYLAPGTRYERRATRSSCF